MTAKTVLNDTHRALGARMVDFGGWDMPINYGSQIEEHHAVRRDAGMFDVSHMTVIDLHGPRTREFLRHLLANSVDKLKVSGKALYSCMLNERGGVIDDLIVYFFDDAHYRLVVNAATRDKDLAWIEAQAKAFDVTVKERPEFAMIAVQGPNARGKVIALLHEGDRPRIEKLGKFAAAAAQGPHGMPLFVARTGYTGEDGFELFCDPADAVPLWHAVQEAGEPFGITPAGLGSRDTLRLEAGMPLYGNELDRETNPYEAGMGRLVKLEKGAFAGSAALARIREHGPRRRLVGLVMRETAIPRHGYPVLVDGLEAGTVTSGTASPTLGEKIAMAYLPAEAAAIGAEVQVVVRERPYRAEQVKLPFYKRPR